MNDAQLVDLYLSRDEEAIQKTREKYGRRLQSLAYHIVQDRQTAEECESDAYMCTWKSIPPHAPRQHFYLFLARITRQLSLNRCRSRCHLKRESFVNTLSSELEQCIPFPNNLECQLDDPAFAAMLNDFLGQLNTKKRKIFIRRYWYLDSISDIAKQFSMTEAAVKTTLMRCRKALLLYFERKKVNL